MKAQIKITLTLELETDTGTNLFDIGKDLAADIQARYGHKEHGRQAYIEDRHNRTGKDILFNWTAKPIIEPKALRLTPEEKKEKAELQKQFTKQQATIDLWEANRA